MIRSLTWFVSLALIPLPLSLSAQVEEERDVAVRPLLGVHLGYAGIEKAKNTMELGASAEIGSYRTPRLRFALGVDYLSSETTRPPRPGGSFSDLSVNGDLRFKPFQVRTVAPYLGGGVGLHFRGNDYQEPNIADIYDGVAVGVQGFLGVLVDGAEDGRWGFSGEFRAVRAKDLHRSSLRAGVFLRL
jgi:hypothetical protein